ncbi:MAG: DUF1800 domain-containing protein [Bacteroidota bacterium]
MKFLLPLICGLLLCPALSAQEYYDFLGAGHTKGITVTTSSNDQENGEKSIDGFPVENEDALIDASRFLAQAALGYDYEMVQMAAAMGFEAWIDEQLSLPRTPPNNVMEQIYVATDYNIDILEGYTMLPAVWWNTALKYPDVLRQRMNYNLSQIFVVSAFGSDLFEDYASLNLNYYDLLNQHSFGNYRTLLDDMGRNPSMGLYLSHFGNPKSDPANNIHPDENYAREVMQLFSIGLYELNNDGTRKLDQNGNFIPTYDNDDIKEFAKVFTGFSNGTPNGEFGVFDGSQLSATSPMVMYDEWHEPGEKFLLNGMVVPSGQTGLEDYNMAMDNLFNHPNVGPFISKAFIQFFVTSNPSPAYVDRVATAFNDNGQGVRGDLGAMLKAILLDEEARTCSPLSQPNLGKLREPVLRYSTFMKAFNPMPENGLGIYGTTMFGWYEQTGQVPMYSPSVFNFYSPEFQPNGPIADADLVAPSFQIHNSTTSIGYINEMTLWTFLDYYFSDYDFFEEFDSTVFLDFETELDLASNPSALVDHLNILLAAGQLSESTQQIIETAVGQMPGNELRVDMAVYLILLSPEFAVLK